MIYYTRDDGKLGKYEWNGFNSEPVEIEMTETERDYYTLKFAQTNELYSDRRISFRYDTQACTAWWHAKYNSINRIEETE